MAIQVAIDHHTHYKFDRQVSLSSHVFRLRPAPHSRTPISAYSLKISPKNHFINWQQDPFGNYLARVVFNEKTDHLSVIVEVIAEMKPINPFDFFVESYAEKYPFKYPNQLAKELSPYLEINERGPLMQQLLREVDTSPQPVNDFMVQVNQLINQKLAYEIRMDPGVQSCELTLKRKIGSCRDFSWLMLQLFRHLGIASRFVSGYSVQLKPDVKPLEGPAGVLEDVTDLHAWTEVYIPGAGWVGLDSTSGLLATEGHIPLACTPDYKSASPVEGYTDICETEFSFLNRVTRVQEDPRVTKPYTDKQWKRIMVLGEEVDQHLVEGDIRLTMGGEPTFVSIDDMESAQWNTAADGLHKRRLAWDLAKRLRDTFGKGGLLHYGQGKWYPGEPLPRWAYGLYWRKDGQPIRESDQYQANPTTDYGYTHEHAQTFTAELANNLGLSTSYIHPAYEDVYHQLWEEGNLPSDIDPLAADLSDQLERKALFQHLDRGLGTPVGFALPLEWDFLNGKWRSCKWNLRRDQLYLMPGNSPMGLRLPLNSIPLTGKEEVEIQVERSPLADLPPLQIRQASERMGNSSVLATPAQKQLQDTPTVRMTLCVEVREGKLYIFLPPMSYLEHYLEVIDAIENVCQSLDIAVMIEGYEPPADWRLEKIKITPDPGVIEVNIHPSSSWKELVDNTDTLYEQARLARLATEKFMLDGRHTGTGGGNHVTIGGTKPADSPLLRRPDLLRSLLNYWQHHPGLSYLFSSAFIGPTSQAPRIDEGKIENLYELEIAFNQIPDTGYTPPWLVDRIFRHLLTDITGNTHRAEFCIDKLYSPDSLSGRLGLLELRGFDMPPHAKMSLVQILLIRSLIAHFWHKPYHKKLVRWGTALHDRFLLPYYCMQDLEEVVEDLQRGGIAFEADWLAPFSEFRFPHYGSVQLKGINIELRMAIEPWHVLGEEMSNTGTARFVDSSLERVQVKINGLTDSRYVLLCNGCRVPLQPTGIHGEYVASVRYRAWQPPSALHPTIGVDSPLVFDLVDTWNNKSVGGCTYHVSHPGGRAYDTFPVNALEAESRRTNRFTNFGHSPEILLSQIVQYKPVQQGVVSLVPNYESFDRLESVPEINRTPEYPYTLDLRLFKSKR